MQSPASASSLAESPPAASPQLGRWICQQGLQSAKIRDLLLLLAAATAAAAASTTTALGSLRLVTLSSWCDRIITTVVMASAGTGFESHRMPWYEQLGLLPGDCSTRCDDLWSEGASAREAGKAVSFV